MVGSHQEATIERLRRSLSTPGDSIEFSASVSRETAEKILRLLSAEAGSGAVVLPARDEYRPSAAASILGMSRPHVNRLLNEGKLRGRKVGSHWRISAEELARFMEAEERASDARLDQLMAVSNEVGYFD